MKRIHLKERDDARLTLSEAKPGRLTCVLDGTLDPTLYVVPLTLVCEAPGATSARAERAGRELPVRISNSRILVEAAPGKETITVTWH